MNNNLMITMSGGTTTVINATLAGIIEQAQKSKVIGKIYAGYPGIVGVIKKNILDLTDASRKMLDKLYITPASGSIGITRLKPINKIHLETIESVFKDYGIGYYINIGGNGTIKQSVFFGNNLKGVKIAALPKTVDNDLGDRNFKKLLFTPGFPSCVQYWYHKVKIFNQENLGAFSHDKVLIAQTFGRETGFIAGAARLADPERKLPLIILLPEDRRPTTKVLQKIKSVVRKHKRAIVIMSEGYRIGNIGMRKDHTGQTMYSSSQTTNAQILVNKLTQSGIQSRAFIPGFDQRDEILLTSEWDLKIAHKIGSMAIKEFENGNNKFLVTISEKKKSKYKPVLNTIPLSQIEDFSRKMPPRWIAKGKFDVSDEYIRYVQSITDFKSPFVNKKLNGVTFSPSPLLE